LRQVCQELSRVRRKANYLILLARVNQGAIFQGKFAYWGEGELCHAVAGLLHPGQPVRVETRRALSFSAESPEGRMRRVVPLPSSQNKVVPTVPFPRFLVMAKDKGSLLAVADDRNPFGINAPRHQVVSGYLSPKVP